MKKQKLQQIKPFTVFTFLVVASVLLLPGTLGYYVYLDRNFGEKISCISDISSFFGTKYLNPLQTSNGSQYHCQSYCYSDSFTNPKIISSLQVINTIGIVIQIPLTSNTDPYSQVKFELTYFGKYPITAELQYPDSKVSSFTFNKDPDTYFFTDYASYTLDPSIVDTSFDLADSFYINCPDKMKIKATTLSISKHDIITVQTPEPALVLTLTVASSLNLSNLRSIRVSKNCVENCLTCSTDTSCSVCFDGFTSNTFPSGITACEQIGSVCSSLSNCMSCALSGADSVCLSCLPGFTLSSGSCTANTPTPGSPCTTTQYNDNGICTEYSSIGYYESRFDSSLIEITSLSSQDIQTTYKCPSGKLAVVMKENNYQNYKCKCFFEKCVSCSTLTSCDVCDSGFVFNYSQKLCVDATITNNQLSLQQNVTSTGYIFKIVLSKGIQYSTLDNNDIQVIIDGFTDFTYNLVGMTNGDTISISVTCTKLVKNKKITITFTNIAFVSANAMTQSSLTTDLEAYLNLSQNEYDRANNAKTIAKIVATIIVWFLIPIAICGYFSTIMQTVDVVAFLYYILYVSVRFPINVTSFAQAFKILQLSVVLNFFGTLVNDNTFLDSAVKWMKQTTDCYFLASTGQSVSVFFVVIGLYLFTKMMAKMEFAYISDYFQKAVIRTWEFGGILDGVWLVYVYVLVGVFLQFQDTGCNESSCSLNYTLFAFSGIFVGLIPIIVFILIRYANSVQYQDYLVMKLGSLFTGVRLFLIKDSVMVKEDDNCQFLNEPAKLPQTQQQNISISSQLAFSKMSQHQKLMFRWTKYVIPILYARRVLFTLIICFIYHHPYAQIIAISIMNFIILSYFLIIQPFISKYQNLKSAISELLLIVFQVLTALLISDKEDSNENTRILIGWGLIAVSSILIIWHAISIIVQFLLVVRKAYLNWKQQRSQAKVISLDINDQTLNISPNLKNKPILQFLKQNNKQKIFNPEVSNCVDNNNNIETANQSPPSKIFDEPGIHQIVLKQVQGSQDTPLLYSPKRVRQSRLSLVSGHQEQQLHSFREMDLSTNQLNKEQIQSNVGLNPLLQAKHK